MNSIALLPETGKLFYLKNVDGLGESDKVIVDMSDVTALPSVFLNVSFPSAIDALEEGLKMMVKI